MKTLGIAAHSAEGATLCFNTAARHGGSRLGPFMHPNIVMSAIPMALSMPAWENDNHEEVGRHLANGVQMVADAGADFFVCPDNTAHIVLEKIVRDLPIPGLHIAHVVCAEIVKNGWTKVGLLGTKWTMTGPVYERAFVERGLTGLIPGGEMRTRVNSAIFDELCNGIISEASTSTMQQAIEDVWAQGAECVVLGCTEIPLVITPENSALPPIDSTRLLARYAVDACIDERPLRCDGGWVVL